MRINSRARPNSSPELVSSGAPPDAMASKAHSGDSRCVAHHMNDDPIAADRYRKDAATAAKDRYPGSCQSLRQIRRIAGAM